MLSFLYMKLCMAEHAIVSLISMMPNCTQKDIDRCYHEHGISNKTFRRHVKRLISEWILSVNNVAFESSSKMGKSYNKRYNLSYNYIREMQKINKYDPNGEMTITIKPTDVVKVVQNDRVMTFDPKEWFWRENGNKVRPSYDWEKYKTWKKSESKGQIRVTWIKDEDLKKEVREYSKFIVEEQRKRDIWDIVTDFIS